MTLSETKIDKKGDDMSCKKIKKNKKKKRSPEEISNSILRESGENEIFCNEKKSDNEASAKIDIDVENRSRDLPIGEKNESKGEIKVDNQNLSHLKDSIECLEDYSTTRKKSKKNKNKRLLSENCLDEKDLKKAKLSDKEEVEDNSPVNCVAVKEKKKKSKHEKITEDLILNDDGNLLLDEKASLDESMKTKPDDANCMNKSKKKKKKEYKPEEWAPLSLSPNKESIKITSDSSKNKESSKNFLSEIKNLVEDDEDDSEVRDLIFSRKKPKWSKKEKRKLCKRNNQNIFSEEPHTYTTSIAIPASILEETCLLLELRTYVVGQLARVACIYSVDEIIVFNDGHADDRKNDEFMGMMKMILEYQECPQYLRKALFPYHRFMSKAGVLNPLNAPHHLLASQWFPYREGVVEECGGPRSTVNVGLRIPVVIDRPLEARVRVTVKFPPETKTMAKPYGIVVSPEEPRLKGGLYWGYTVRIANSISEVFKGDRFPKYDLLIGTSDKGKDINTVEKFEPFSNALIVFGGVQGLENGFKLDSTLSKKEPGKFFDHYLNICPNQQSRTIRTEEAVTMTLSRLSHMLSLSGKVER